MSDLTVLDGIELPFAEEAFFLSLQDRRDPRLSHWATNYHFFSTSQAKLLALVVCALPETDHDALTEVTKALYEEYGSGNVEAVHSRLFARFCLALGLHAEQLPISRNAVEPGILGYLQAIEAGYRSADLAVVLGTYCFLERSAVMSYPLMHDRLLELGFSPAELVFFSTHIVQEAQHDLGASSMMRRFIGSASQQRAFDRQLLRMQEAWSQFWHPFGMRRARVI
ncbi:iron-containing redox enzyme family protein [Variovorax sp.]|jgi:pyrroloquinoline quinone (PQQ) biosynthesis protein C|uniref:iron-containing redox enzyme family protein n=1 Tax=Variovorax sp. TaxID=1871043 RepID=UPI0037D9FCA1